MATINNLVLRKFVLVLVVMLSLISVHAEEPNTTDYFYINDFTIAPGETKEIELCLYSTQPYRSLQVNIYMPEGLEIVFDEDEYEYIIPSDRIPSRNWPYQSDFVADGSLLVSAYSSNNRVPITAGDGALFTMKVKASESLSRDCIIQLKESEITGHVAPYVNYAFYGPDTECHVKVLSSTTLADLIAEGNTSKTYEVTDLIAIQAVDNGRLLLCKDDNGYASKDEMIASEDCIDFMHTAKLTEGIKSTIPASYDQSNWIGLRIPDGVDLSASVIGCPLKGVVGKLVDAVNPELVLEQAPEANGEKVDFTPNVYIAASFGGTQHSAVSGKDYFFVTPKPMEYANVEWAQWNGEKFVAPLKSSNNNWNPASLQGEFEFNGSYLEQGGVFLEEGHVYKMLPAVVKYKDNNNYDHVYVLGTVNDQGWSPRKGVEMYTTDGNIYTATVTVNNVNNGYGYFSFTKKLGGVDDNDWAAINSYRFGAVADGDFVVNSEHIGQELSLAYWSGDSRSFKVGQGTYKLTVNLSGLKLIITPAQAGAPGIKAATNDGYVVYPLQINKVTTENNGVITAIDNLQAGKTVTRVVYYNLMGVESDKPHPGINIVETRYSDGSRSTVKVVK